MQATLLTDLPALSIAVQIVLGVCVIICLAIMAIAKRFFDDSDPDMLWHDNFTEPNLDYYQDYDECHRPFIATKTNCPHNGEKTDVVMHSAVGCEEVHTFCDDCGEDLGKRTDC